MALVKRLTKLYAQREGWEYAPVTDSEIEEFMNAALARAGAEELITPREIIRDFLTILNILRDNKDAKFADLLKKVSFTQAPSEEAESVQSATLGTTKNKISLFDIDI